MIVAAGVSGVLLGSGTTGVGLLIGAVLERWRDDTKWRREEQTRWISDLRLIHRELLAKGDEVWRKSTVQGDQIRWLENARPEDKESFGQSLMQTMLDISAIYEDVALAVADLDLIAGEKEREAGARYANAVNGLMFSDTTVEGWKERATSEYDEAREALVSAAREALRQAEQTSR